MSAILGAGLDFILGRAGRNQQNRQQKEFWNLQNEYNLPINQVKRLKEAGLNPKLMYGQGSAGAGNAQSIGQASGQGYQTDFKQATMLNSNMAINAKDLELKDEQKLNLEVERFKSLADIDLSKATAEEKRYLMKLRGNLLNSQVEKINNDIILDNKKYALEAFNVGVSANESLSRIMKIAAETKTIDLSRPDIVNKLKAEVNAISQLVRERKLNNKFLEDDAKYLDGTGYNLRRDWQSNVLKYIYDNKKDFSILNDVFENNAYIGINKAAKTRDMIKKFFGF